MWETLTTNRKIRKGLVELAMTSAIALVSLLIDTPEIGIGGYGLFVLEQFRRVLRDSMHGEPGS